MLEVVGDVGDVGFYGFDVFGESGTGGRFVVCGGGLLVVGVNY